MKAALERWLLQRWYGGERPGLALRALAGVYRMALQSRSVHAMAVGVPVVVVGNFTAGGTGKTPLVIALAQHLSTLGWRPAVVSRGHGRRGNAPVRVTAATSAAEAGDEPVLIHRRAGVPVFVDADRVAAARAAVAAGCNLVIADDGLQHRRLARDVEIEVVDGARGYGNGLLLPAGPLRERPRATDFRIINLGASPSAVPMDDPAAPRAQAAGDWTMRLQLAASADPVGRVGAQPRVLSSFIGDSVQAIAGIGHPARFFDALHDAGLRVDGHAFADHHVFTADELRALPRPLLMTEKDATKCAGFDLDDAWSVGVDAQLTPGLLEAISRRVGEASTRG